MRLEGRGSSGIGKMTEEIYKKPFTLHKNEPYHKYFFSFYLMKLFGTVVFWG